MKYIFIIGSLFLVGCVQKTSNSDLFLNQNNCTTLGGDRVAIVDGEIKLKSDNYLIGKITVLDKNTISVIDDTGVRETLNVKIDTRNGKRLLYSIMDDGKNIPFACGLD
ncbi:hypothetical protein [Polynucleobacter victoriensis]|uniref:Uncharacterized protein n=1 Tax=Polynucleobacter victoriensis TaxID=2049319 RepID=A0A212T6U3_9BURK|nr:hypothetical protein [Polynucleobacter victoriensis]SNC61748.1 hypothetical protein SAMN06295916_0538 [Polynucleobacter victoriensis]